MDPATPTTAVSAVVTTAPDAGVAQELAARLVEERLAACANVVPGVLSFFWWEGEVQKEEELLVVFKTTRAAYGRLRERLVELHPYDVPEVLAFPVPDGAQAYLDWVRREVASS